MMKNTCHCATALAVLVLLGPVAAWATPSNAASPDQKRAAQKMFEAGDELYESGRFEDATEAFRSSYNLVASPNSRLMWARGLRELKRIEEACEQYEGTIRDAQNSQGRYADAQRAAESELAALTDQLGFINVEFTPENAPVEIRINGQQTQWFPHRRIAVPLPEVDVQVLFADGTSFQEHVQLKSRETRTINAQLVNKPPTSEPPAAPIDVAKRATSVSSETQRRGNPIRTAAYIAGATGVVGLGTFTVFGLLNRSTHSELESNCVGGCPSSEQDNIDKGRRYQLLANIGLGVAGVATAAAVTLFVVSSSGKSNERNFGLALSPGSVNIMGRF